jgi:hypothetical protein
VRTQRRSPAGGDGQRALARSEAHAGSRRVASAMGDTNAFFVNVDMLEP